MLISDENFPSLFPSRITDEIFFINVFIANWYCFGRVHNYLYY